MKQTCKHCGAELRDHASCWSCGCPTVGADLPKAAQKRAAAAAATKTTTAKTAKKSSAKKKRTAKK